MVSCWSTTLTGWPAWPGSASTSTCGPMPARVGAPAMRPASSTSPGQPARLLDVVAGRSGQVYTDWIAEREQQWREQIRIAALDPYRGYTTALATTLSFFHVLLLGA